MTSLEPNLLEFGRFSKGSLILDVGGGKGSAVSGARDAGLSAVVVDRSAAALAAVPEGMSRVRADGGHLPFRHGAADGAILRAVMHHFLEPARVVKEAARVCAPGATLVIVDRVAPDDDVAQALRNAVDRLRDAHHVWTWTMDEISIIAGAGRWVEEERVDWYEEKDLETWLARTRATPACSGWVREMVERDREQGGPAFGARVDDSGRVVVRERWCALLFRKPGAAR